MYVVISKYRARSSSGVNQVGLNGAMPAGDLAQQYELEVRQDQIKAK